MSARARNIFQLYNHGWDVMVRVMNQNGKYRVDVYSNSGQRLVKSHDCVNIRAALIKACDLVGED